MQKMRLPPSVRKAFIVAAGLWVGGSAFVLLDASLSKDHYKQQIWHRLGQGDSFTIPHLTLFAKPLPPQGSTLGSTYRAEQNVTIDGQRYVLYFRSDDPDLAARASRYVKALPAQDAQELEATSLTSKRVVMLTLLKGIVGIPLVLLAIGAVVVLVFRAFRLKAEHRK
jgi:hypothetical protein